MNTYLGPCLIVMQYQAIIVQIPWDTKVLAIFNL